MKKILFLSQVFPYPADGGGKIKTLNSLLTLAKKFEVTAVFISEYNPTPSEINYLKKRGVKKVIVFFNPRILESVKDNLMHLIWNFATFRPHYVFQYTWPPAFQQINRLIQNIQPDIIHIDHINIAQYLPKEKKQIWILEHHNLEFYLLYTRFVHTHKWSRKVYLFIETVLTYLFERSQITKFDYTFTISEVERSRCLQYFPIIPSKVSAQPLVYPQDHKVIPTKGKNILFVGNLGWPPNEDAIEWFITKCWNSIRTFVPEAKLTIVGKPYEKLLPLLLNSPGITYVGFQKNIKKFLNKAAIFVLPFRMGGGVRLKALTAMASHIPIVSTPLGVEGLDVVDKQEINIAENSQAFVQQCVSLLCNSDEREKMQQCQKKYMMSHSKKKNQKYLSVYNSIVNRFL